MGTGLKPRQAPSITDQRLGGGEATSPRCPPSSRAGRKGSQERRGWLPLAAGRAALDTSAWQSSRQGWRSLAPACRSNRQRRQALEMASSGALARLGEAVRALEGCRQEGWVLLTPWWSVQSFCGPFHTEGAEALKPTDEHRRMPILPTQQAFAGELEMAAESRRRRRRASN